MNKRVSTIWRFLIPIIVLLIIAPIVFIQYLTSQQLALIELNAKDQAKTLVNLLNVTDALMIEEIDTAMHVFKSRAVLLGAPRIDGVTNINANALPNLMLGTTALTRNLNFVDNLNALTSAKAAIFVKNKQDFTNITTNLIFNDGTRAIGSTLNVNNSIVKSLLAKQSFKGVEDFSGEPYITRYDPIFDCDDNVVGAFYIGHKIDRKVLKEAINQTRALKTSVTLVLNQHQKILFHSNNISLQQAEALVKTHSEEWVFVKEDVTKWQYQVLIAYPLKDARVLGLNNLTFLIVASVLLGAAFIYIILAQLHRLILNPIGADPAVAIDVVQRIAAGDLEQDYLKAEPETLMASVLMMRSKLNESFHQLQDNAKRLSLSASVFDNAHDGIFITNSDLKIIDVNPAFSKITGYAREAVINHNPAQLGFAFHDVNFFEKLLENITESVKCRGEVWNLHNDGNVYAAWLDVFAVYDELHVISHYVGLFSDISEVKVQQKNLEHMAYHDPLTQLPNRSLFSDRLKQELLRTNPEKELLAICYFDLDGFKPVNDDLGHEAGDLLLVNLATRIRACLRDNDTIARLGGDEFAILLSGLESKEECVQTLDRLLEVIKLPYEIFDHSVRISASIGYTIYPLDLSEADTLLRHADHAMYHVKVNGRGFHHQFDAEQDRQSRDSLQEREAIAAALPNGEFRLHYQPKVNMLAGSVIGLEALIRWQHPEKGLRSPAEFLPMLEEDTVFSVQIGEWVITETLRQINEWQTAGLTLKVSVNISAKHMMQVNFADRLKLLLSMQPAVSPSLLELEITETAAIEDIAGVAKTINDCKQLGVSFALDDFGVGYSSLTYLRRLPVEVIKIDQSFIRDMLQDSEDLAVVSGVISLSRSFGLDVVAEGVETPEHGVQLLKMGCVLAQGYGISKPMEAGKVLAWVSAYKPDQSWSNYKAKD